MVTKLKNISYSSFTKCIMFLVAVALMLVVVFNFNMFWVYDDLSLEENYINYLERYDEEKGTEYSTSVKGTISILEPTLENLENINLLVQDNGVLTMQEVLDLGVDEYINQGIGFYLVDNSNGEMISSSDKSIEKDEYYWAAEDVYIKSTTENTELSKEIELYTTYSDVVAEDGSTYQYAKYYHGYTLYVMVLDDNLYSELNSYHDEFKDEIRDVVVNGSIGAMLLLCILIYFIVVAGRSNINDEVNVKIKDKVYFDILLIGGITTFIILTVILLVVFYDYSYIFSPTKINLAYVAYTVAITSIVVYLLTNLSIKLKTEKFWESISIIVFTKFIYRKTVKIACNIFIKDTNLSMKVLAGLGLVIALYSLFTSVLMILLSILYFALLISSIKLTKAIKTVANNEKYVVDEKLSNIPYNESLKQLEAISKNTNEVYLKGLKAQNTKTELITNVSHDLRTPLTSIVGYIDLLEKRGNDYDEETQEYIRILKEKSNRMTQMVGDLFDLAKTTSGDVKLDLTKLDVKKLIEQTVSELDDFILDENKIQLNLDERLFILADGNKMYRVMQNLIDNALKYSLDGTRIYIEVFENVNNEVQIEFKNIANYEMNFKSDDITERFTRGDKSRTTEGSGLGLSIAETYTNLNGGDFSVVVDGDLFKVVIKIKKV